MDRIRTKHHHLLRVNIKDIAFWLLLVLLTLPHMKPPYLARIPTVDLAFDIMRAASFLLIVLWYVIKRQIISLVIVLVALWRAFLLYSTVIHEGSVYVCLLESFSILSIMLLYDLACGTKKSVFISAQLFCFELIVYINYITEILFPEGMYVNATFPYKPNWFLGYYNIYSRWFIPGLMFAWLYRKETGNNLRTYLFTAGVIVSIITVFAGGEAFSLMCMTLVFLLFKNRTSIFNYMNYWMLHVYFIVLVFAFRIQDVFEWLLNNLLGKMDSFLARQELWEKTLPFIKQSPIIGHGIKDGVVRMVEYHSTWTIHAHNLFLELLYQGGIVGLILFVLVVAFSGRKLMKYSDTMESKIISTAFLGWCVVTLVEPYVTPFFMGMFTIAYRSNGNEYGNSECRRRGRLRSIY